jgi:hypothetical protein
MGVNEENENYKSLITFEACKLCRSYLAYLYRLSLTL